LKKGSGVESAIKYLEPLWEVLAALLNADVVRLETAMRHPHLFEILNDVEQVLGSAEAVGSRKEDWTLNAGAFQ
jgi:hypothetical protein